jgi:hypothetical protein
MVKRIHIGYPVIFCQVNKLNAMNVYTTINKGLSFTIMKNILIYFYKMRVFYIFIFLYIKVLKREQNKKERKSVNKNRCILLWNKKRSTLNVYICTA